MEAQVLDTTTATPAPTAAPATVETPVQQSRPTSFAEAFARDEAKTPTPETPAATVPVESQPTTNPSESKQGPIPFDVHKTALENARTKAREEALADWKPYERIRSVQPEVLEEWFDIANRMSTDPVAFTIEMIDRLQTDPRYAPQLRSHAGKLLAAGRGANTDPEPQPDREIVDGSGNVVGRTYADGGAAREAWLKRQWLAEVNQQIQPLKADHDSRVQAETQARETSQAIEAHADAQIAEIRDIVESDELLSAVHQAMADHPDWSPRKCALYVRDEKVVSPKLSDRAKTQTLDELKTKAAAQTMNPSAAASTSTTRPKSFHDPSLKW